MNRFPSIEAFYAARGGERSGESDFGVWWTDSAARFPQCRVSVVHDTGDVYAVNQRGGEVELLGTLDHDCGDSDADLRHGASCAYTIAENLLPGWTDRIHQLDSLEWVRARLATVAA